ncbi:MAG: hypothetical protein F7C35_09065 [Desulfurococcales archaeon]|nr:hypothetical protein [Desulfurococcales archaeon]
MTSTKKKLLALIKLVTLTASAVKLYLWIRVYLWKWRRKSMKGFQARLRGLPRDLREDLSREYREKLRELRLPTVREALKAARRRR